MKLNDMRGIERTWEPGLTQVPYWLYSDQPIYRTEQQRLFQGPTWNYLCLEADIPEPGDYRTTFVGETPVIVVRDDEDQVQSFENRCAHRGSLIALKDSGKAQDFTCVYHAWRYDLQGNLKGVAFEQGVNGMGGMPPDFCKEHHGPRKLRTATVAGLVFGSFDEDVPSIEEYLGDAVLEKIERVLPKPVEVLGRFKQTIPNNWKLYMENVKDSYHASLLHVFFTTFRINRLSQKGGVIISETGAHHISWSKVDHQAQESSEYNAEKLRSDKEGYALADPTLLDGCDEFGDGITLQILSVFPGFVIAQIQNTLAIRQILPVGTDKTVLNWTYIGFADDSPQLRRMRLKQLNLTGPAGFISMEDGAVGGFVQRGIAGAKNENAILEMGGDSIETQDNRTTEASVRGFWNAYRSYMEI
ncbi:terephthalate 1,2-dioxygenase [Advenella kashmirensis W13003]|uniref:Terephthalate 1,2-dioxygenase n=1 Tax=Advenella kashmirensis W13003 TaxID=1424334 RepID=V8QQH0_9BURK|nr:Rieske 2Fe-2S domain-containing protein [Advenella kashmirensis]ETF01540.1 terephthalate 1,2-dioxygenase [Advenella kashmirensis W13003]